MKKKGMLGYIIAFAFVFISTIVLTACGGNPKFEKLVIDVNGTEQANDSYDFGNFEYGTTPSLTYTVYAKYDDGSRKKLETSDYSEQFSLNGTTIQKPTTFEVGNYSITLIYKEYNYTINFNVVYPSRTYQTVLNPSKTVWTYGSELPTLYLTDNTIGLTDDCYRYIEQSYVANPNAPTQEELLNSHQYYKDIPLDLVPGSYYLYINVPQTGNYAATNSTLKPVTVNKGTLTVANANNIKAVYNYKYSSTFGNIKPSDLNIVEKDNENIRTNPIVKFAGEDFSDVTWEWVEPNKELNANSTGTIKIKFNLPSTWQDKINNLDPIDIPLEINKAQILKPTIDDSGDQIDIYVGEQLSSTRFSEWNTVALTITNENSVSENVDIALQDETHIILDRKTVSGTYTYKLSLKDKVNYAWADGTTDDVVKQIVVAGSDITEKNSVFSDVKLLKTNGDELTQEELENYSEFVNLTTSFNTSNEGKTAKCEQNGTVSGSFEMIGQGTFDELINPTDPENSACPYYYTYNPKETNTIKMYQKNEYDVIMEDSILVGNLVGNTLKLTYEIYNSDLEDLVKLGIIWKFTFQITEE